MTVDRLDIYGDYADGYCEAWAPSTSALFTGSAVSFTPARMPQYPTFTMSWSQAVDKASGAQTLARDPYVQEMLITLPWTGMSGADKTALEAFFNSSEINGQAGAFSLYNPVIGPALSVRFASDTLPDMPEVGYDRYRVELQLRTALNYPQLAASGAAPAITGNRFVCGPAAFLMPVPLRPTTGYATRRPQTYEVNSTGAAIIYSKSRLKLLQHRYAMALDFQGFINLQALLFSFTHGARNPFQWVDQGGTSRTVRLASNQVVVKQTLNNRYETELVFVEEL